jgi:hypothetical protein
MQKRLHADLLNVQMRSSSSCIAAITQETMSERHRSSAGKQRSGIDYSKWDNLEYEFQMRRDRRHQQGNKTRLTLPIRIQQVLLV